MAYNYYAAQWNGVQYFGKWVYDGTRRYTQTQYSKCIFTFEGDYVSLYVNARPDGADAEVFVDGVSCGTISTYNSEPLKTKVFEKSGIEGNRIHELTISCRKIKNNPNAVLELWGFEAEKLIDYPTYLHDKKVIEYGIIERDEKQPSDPKTWKKAEYKASAPKTNVKLNDSIFKKMIADNTYIIKKDYDLPFYCEGDCDIPGVAGPGWSHFLPASNEGRLIAGAYNALRWEDDEKLREMIAKIISDIKNRVREDGYHNYYPESQSFADTSTPLSERKNYDRVFWTRAMLYASEMGNKDAAKLVRDMYDWLESKPEYLSKLIQGTNATNAGPGLPLMANSTLAKESDMLAEQKYVDQDYFIETLSQGVSLAFASYPGDRPHCYELLILETLVDEYRATGLDKYKNAMLGGWKIWKNYYRHIGGAAAICEVDGPYSPGSYYITTGHNGETCATVFWSIINGQLMQLYPGNDSYASELEEALFNAIAACRLPEGGWTRYHVRFHGEKEWGRNFNTCCEVSSTMFIPTIPQYICTYGENETFLNLPIASSNKNGQLHFDIVTGFPYDKKVDINIAKGTDKPYTLNIRIPKWVEGRVVVTVNNEVFEGRAGEYLPITRQWLKGDQVSFSLTCSPRLIKYTGHDQPKDNSDRYALMVGPMLMALTGVESKEVLPLRNRLTIEPTIPRIDASPEEFLANLKEVAPLKYTYGRFTFVPYYTLDKEYFTCYPIIQK